MKVSKDSVQKVYAFVKENPNAYNATIQKGTGIREAVVREALNELKAEGKIVGTQTGKRVEYVVKPTGAKKTTAKVKSNTSESESEITYVVKPADAKSDKKQGRNYGRNFNQMVYNGKAYRKAQLVLAMLSDYVKKHNPTFNELKSVLPDTLLSGYGVFQEKSAAKEKPGRYYTAASQQIQLKDGKTIVVCTQWSTENIQPTLGAFKKLGFKITAE
jgi:hypothetical protein